LPSDSGSPRSRRLTGAISTPSDPGTLAASTCCPDLRRLLGSGKAVYAGGVTGQVISVVPLMVRNVGA
jgi:hypothetical protein